MKKIVLSLTVIITFTIFSLYERSKPLVVMSVILPKKISTASPTITGTSLPISTYHNPLKDHHPAPSITSNTPVPTTDTLTPTTSSAYRDGSYTGDLADAFYGNIQVEAIIKNGRITDVKFLQYPNDRSTSIYINSQADPMLTQEALQVQSANVDIISGATDSSQAFIQSLQSALNQAQN